MAGGGRARTAARGAACGSDVTVAPATLSWRRSPPRADAFTGYHSDADAVSVAAWPRPLIEATITCSALRVRRSRESGGARCCSHVYRYELQRQELQAAAAGQGRLPAGSLRQLMANEPLEKLGFKDLMDEKSEAEPGKL
ncbi:cytochrome c oxidase assembly protein COX19 isoform X1 [Gallus gallus]|uniref:cytochrome c oxidase assembly protein COX19 isoform X1 n=1 Tax=Gallus gallus TaxID=9031 RepID=UPI000739C03E|nr:cytochrome c oxidase assembly protein COX19 isoform X1 [Gallus gallus]